MKLIVVEGYFARKPREPQETQEPDNCKRNLSKVQLSIFVMVYMKNQPRAGMQVYSFFWCV